MCLNLTCVSGVGVLADLGASSCVVARLKALVMAPGACNSWCACTTSPASDNGEAVSSAFCQSCWASFSYCMHTVSHMLTAMREDIAGEKVAGTAHKLTAPFLSM